MPRPMENSKTIRVHPCSSVANIFPRLGEPMSHWITKLDPAPGKPGLPLSNLTFAIKDNIDLAGVPTTAACPAYSYTPTHSAPVVQRLIDAGAIPAGKTNMDQFATGLVGTRSPYGACSSIYD